MLIIPDSKSSGKEIVRYNTDGYVNYTFDWQTCQIGFSSDVFLFSPASPFDVLAGGVYGAGKLNGEWAAIVIKKQ